MDRLGAQVWCVFRLEVSYRHTDLIHSFGSSYFYRILALSRSRMPIAILSLFVAAERPIIATTGPTEVYGRSYIDSMQKIDDR